MTASPPTGALSLTDAATGEAFTLAPDRLVIAGYTGRDRVAVRAHIDELADLGVAPPPRTPMFYEIPAGLLTCEPAIVVNGAQTSGEVEPVLIASGATRYLGLGSDHTDRQVERRDIAESKASAPKPLASRVLPLDAAGAVWDDIELACWVDGEPYQRGELAAMLAPPVLLRESLAAGHPLAPGTVMFCGTLPLHGGEFRYGATYRLELRLPDGTSLSHTYDVKRRSI